MVVFNAIALVIGVSNYSYLPELKNSLNDAREIRRKLNECGYDVIYLENPTKAQVLEGIEHLSQLLKKCRHLEVLIYTAGHGIFNNIAHYILLTEFYDKNTPDANQLTEHGFSVEEIVHKIQTVNSNGSDVRAIVVILDACRDLSPHINQSKGISFYDKTHSPQTMFELCHDARIGILVSYACEIGGCVRNGKVGEHSVYTRHLLEQIFIPGNPIINALGRAHQLVVYETKSDQKPHMEVNFPHYFMYPLKKVEARQGKFFNSNGCIHGVPTLRTRFLSRRVKCVPAFGNLFSPKVSAKSVL